jgi:hypothetical protein
MKVFTENCHSRGSEADHYATIIWCSAITIGNPYLIHILKIIAIEVTFMRMLFQDNCPLNPYGGQD